MKTLTKTQWIVPVLLLFGLVACEPQVSSDPSLDPAPTSESVTFEMEPSTENPNIIRFTNTSEGSFKAMWSFSNGSTAEGDEVEGKFALPGEYTATLTIFTESGQARNSKSLTIDEISYALLDVPYLNKLTGGLDVLEEGKTWVIDSTQVAHFGLGPDMIGDGLAQNEEELNSPIWYPAAPLDKSGLGLYNDRYTFVLDGFNFNMETNGDVFMNGAFSDEFPNGTPVDNDYTAPYTAPAGNFNVEEKPNGDLFLTVTDGTFIGYYAGTRTYKILELEENRMVIRYEQAGESVFAWYHTLIPEGYEHPVVEPEPLPYESAYLYDNFDDEGNVEWEFFGEDFNDNLDNPFPSSINESAKVARYQRSSDKQYDNLFFNPGFEINLVERSIIRLKVYLPADNNYEAGLSKTVAVKLHDVTDDGGNSWQTQAQIVKEVETGKWVELEYDFSAFSDREDFDRIIIQIGGEGHFIPGTFFIDDFTMTAE